MRQKKAYSIVLNIAERKLPTPLNRSANALLLPFCAIKEVTATGRKKYASRSARWFQTIA
jgi:hypothetical protein